MRDRFNLNLENTFQTIKLQYIALPVFVALSLFVYRQGYFSYIFMVLAALIGTVLFIVLSRYFTREDLSISVELPDEKARTFRLLTSILFFTFYGLSFLTLLQGFYTKTVWYYLFVSLCAGLIAAEILAVKTKTQGTFNLLKSFLLVSNITLGNQVLYSNGISLPDLTYHLRILMPIINDGYVPHIGGYEYFPCHHILAAANILIYGTDPKMTYLYLSGFTICLGLLFVFLIGQKFMGLHFGLFAAVLYTSLDYLIMYGLHPVHQAYNYFFSISIFAVSLFIYCKRNFGFTTLYTILVIVMVFTHHYSAMIVLIVISSLFVVEIIQWIKGNEYKFRLTGLIQIYGIILFTQWMYYSNTMGNLIAIIKIYRESFAIGSESLITATAYDILPVKTLFLNTFGSSILILLSVIGFFYLLKNHSVFNGFIIVTTVILSILLVIGVIFRYHALLPDRMYPYLQLFGLVFLGSTGIMWVLDNINTNKNKLKIFGVIALFLFLSFFSISSTIAGFETSLFVGEHTAYPKLYESMQESSFSHWEATHVENEYLFSLDLGYEEELDNVMRGISFRLKNEFEMREVILPEHPDIVKGDGYKWTIIDRVDKTPWIIVKKEGEVLNIYNYIIMTLVPLTKEGHLDTNSIKETQFIIWNNLHLKTGFVIPRGKGHLGEYYFVKTTEDKLYVLDDYDHYYANGVVRLYHKD